MKDSTKHACRTNTVNILRPPQIPFPPIMKTCTIYPQTFNVIFFVLFVIFTQKSATIPLVIPLLRRDFFIKRPTFEWQVPDTQGTATLSLEDNTWGQSVVGNRKNKLGLSRGFR